MRKLRAKKNKILNDNNIQEVVVICIYIQFLWLISVYIGSNHITAMSPSNVYLMTLQGSLTVFVTLFIRRSTTYTMTVHLVIPKLNILYNITTFNVLHFRCYCNIYGCCDKVMITSQLTVATL